MNFRALIDLWITRSDALITRMDAWVAARKSSEMLMIAVLIPVAALFASYELLIPDATRNNLQAKVELNRVHQELSAYRISGGDEELELLRQQIAEIKRRVEQRQLAEDYLQSRLSELEHLYFTRLEWADQLRLIAANAAKEGVSLKLMENRIEPEGAGFMPVMRVHLKGEGGFESVLRYVHTLEAGAKISPVERLTLEGAGGSRLAFELETVLWGLK